MRTITYKDITYSVERKERKTLSIYVEPTGKIKILAPKDISKEELNQIIENKRYWIYKSLSELEELNETKVEREIVDGEGFLYLGRSYKLKIQKNLKRPLTLRQGRFYLDKAHKMDAQDCFKEFYREKGLKHVSERVNYFKGKLGVSPNPVRVMELKNRWGSCSEKHLNFHWKIMMAPMKIIDYIIVHELAHIIEPKHSLRFWEIVGAVIPDYRQRREWLKVNGANLDI
jgi:hypothetical protein